MNDDKTPKQLHDAVTFAFNGWKNNPHVSSYVWAIEVDGAIVLREFDPCNCDDRGEPDATGHEHKISEWPAAPFTLIGEPKTLDHQSLPEMRVTIAAGETPVWGHRVRQLIAPDGRSKFEDVQLFGKVLADGTEQIKTIYPDGSVFEHESMDAAQAHEHPHLALFDRPDVPADQVPVRFVPVDGPNLSVT